MMKIANPFVTGKYVSSEYFCDREEETEMLKHNIVNGRNVALISPRRLGKTGLIEHLFAQDDVRKGYYTFFIDIYSTSSFDEFVYLFGKAVFNQIEKKSSVVERFFSVVKSMRVGFKLDAVSGEPTLDFSLGNVESTDATLNEIFEYMESADRPCLVAIDEFQQITTYAQKNVEAILRTHIQHCKNCQFIFAGSKRHIMSQMFASASKPFYQSAIVLGLGAIPMDTYCSFAQKLFGMYDKTISCDVVQQVYKMMRGCTWYMQVLMNELFALTPAGAVCNADNVDVAVDNIVNAQSLTYSELMSLIGTRQKPVLLAIAKEGSVSKVTSGAFVKKYSLNSASSVQSAIKGLVGKDIIYNENCVYRVYDFFFSLWLKMNY